MDDSKKHDTSSATDLDLDELIAELDAAEEWFPEAAIRRARQARDAVVPRLIRVIEEATALARDGEPPEGTAQILALYMLAEFRAGEALPTVTAAMSLPGESSVDLFGEGVVDDAIPIILALAEEPLAVADSLLQNSDVNSLLRGRLFGICLYLVADGRLSRRGAVEFLERHLRRAIDEDQEMVTFLVSTFVDLAPAEARETIAEAYERDLVESWFIGLSDIDKSIAEGDEKVRDRLASLPPAQIEDVVEELREWFEAPDPHEPPRPLPARFANADAAASLRLDGPESRDEPRVDRNEPCPRGSGKKFKKCCGSRVERP